MFFISIFSREIKLMKKYTTRYIAYVAVLTAMAFALMIFPHLPILPAFSFLEFDFADVPIAFAGLVFGPIAAVITAVLKVALYFICGFSKTSGVGELSNLIVSLAFGLSVSIIYNIRRTKGTLIAAFISGIIIEVIIAMLSNWFIIVPLFIKLNEAYAFLKSAEYIFAGVLPFNLIKFGAQAMIGFMLFKSVEKALPFKTETKPRKE